jgi:hypothetical protein
MADLRKAAAGLANGDLASASAAEVGGVGERCALNLAGVGIGFGEVIALISAATRS